MSLITVKIDNELLTQATAYGEVNEKSALEKFVSWVKIGKIAQDNPTLSYEDITDILQGMADVQENITKPYKFD